MTSRDPGLATVSVLTSLLMMLAVHPSSGQTPPHDYALVIGLGSNARESTLRPLAYSTTDAQAIADLLQQRGYRVATLLDAAATRRSIVATLSRLARDVKPEDSLVLFLTGRTVRNSANDVTYLLTYDSALQELEIDGIRLAHLMDYIREIAAARKLALLDLCSGGDLTMPIATESIPSADARAAAEPPIGLSRGAVPNVETLFRDRQGELLIVLAGVADCGAFESPELGHSFYAAALLEAFNTNSADTNQDQMLAASELAPFVSRRVGEIAVGQGKAQVVTPIALGQGAADWALAKLTDESTQAAVRRYSERLNRWEMHGWITFETKIQAIVALKEWARSPGSQLPEPEARILGEVRKHLDRASTSGQEEALAASLESSLKMVVK